MKREATLIMLTAKKENSTVLNALTKIAGAGKNKSKENGEEDDDDENLINVF